MKHILILLLLPTLACGQLNEKTLRSNIDSSMLFWLFNYRIETPEYVPLPQEYWDSVSIVQSQYRLCNPDSLSILTNLYNMDIDSTTMKYDPLTGEGTPVSLPCSRKILKLQYNLRKLNSLLGTELKFALFLDSINYKRPEDVIHGDTLYINH